MSILSCISTDVEKLVKAGFTDKEISKSVDVDLTIIQSIINFFRQKYSLFF